MTDDLNAAIKRAHAMETHPSNALQRWTDTALSEFPALPTRSDHYELNAIARVTYVDPSDPEECDLDADYAMAIPLDGCTALATSISQHADVYAVALYEVFPNGDLAETPAAAFRNGEGYRL